MHGNRFDSFTRRHVGTREELFNPEAWEPDDPDHDANWDYLIAIICGFGMAIAIGSIGILVWLSAMLVGWP